jgi:hypothetical protein
MVDAATDFYRKNPRSPCDTRVWLDDSGSLCWGTVELPAPHASMESRITFPLASFNCKYPEGIGFCVEPGADHLTTAFERAIHSRLKFHRFHERTVAA